MEQFNNGEITLEEAEIKMQEEVWDSLKDKYNIDLSFE